MERRESAQLSRVVVAVLWAALLRSAAGQQIRQDTPGPASPETGNVTPLKIERNYLEMPLAASVFAAEEIDLAKVVDVQELVQLSPFIVFTPAADARAAGVQIRGIGAAAPSTAAEPAVGVIVDGVTMGRTVQFLTDLADIERIEVLRGPQTALYGKNTSAGLIRIITRRPGDHFEGSTRASVANDGGWGIDAQLSGPLSRAIRGRIALYHRYYGGMVHDALGGGTLNGDDSRGVRAKLEIEISDTSELLLIVDRSEQYRDCCVRVPVDLGGNPFYEHDYSQAGIVVDDENLKVLHSGAVFSDTKTSGISAELNMRFGRTTFSSITSLRGFELDTQEDVDVLPYVGPAYGRAIVPANGASGGDDQEHVQLSQEFRVATDFSDTFAMTTGLSYWNQEVDRYFEREVFYCPAQLGPDPTIIDCAGVEQLHGYGHQKSVVDSVSWALFGQAKRRFAGNWTLNLDWRYTRDTIDAYFLRVSQPAPGVPPPLATSNSIDEANLSGRLALQWDATETTMVYAAYGNGYRAPAFNVDFDLVADNTDPISAETSTTWELGLRSEAFRKRLWLSATAFHSRIADYQGYGFVPDSNAILLTNVGAAVTRGLELDFSARPMPALSLHGALAWTDAFYSEFRNGECYPGQTAAQGCVDGRQDLSAKGIANSPDLKTSLGARYDVALNRPFDLFVNVTFRWQGTSRGAANQDPRLDHDSYAIADLVLGLDDHDGRWSTQLYVKNLFDDFYEDARFARADIFNGGVDHLLARDFQRYLGIGLDYRFGSL